VEWGECDDEQGVGGRDVIDMHPYCRPDLSFRSKDKTQSCSLTYVLFRSIVCFIIYDSR